MIGRIVPLGVFAGKRTVPSVVAEFLLGVASARALMTYKLLTTEDIVAITGMKRNSAQVKWFYDTFKVRVVRRADGSIVMTQEAFEALLAKRMGLPPKAVTPSEIERPKLRPVFDRRKNE